ncbi:MAG: GNAT family N-acetyltransferase [Phycisphaerae bacterium]
MVPNVATIAAVRRARQAYLDQLCERVTLDCGVAHLLRDEATVSPIPEANIVTDFAVQSMPHEAIREVDAFYRERGLQCSAIIPADGQAGDSMVAVMREAGFERFALHCAVFNSAGAAPPTRTDGVTILSARSVRRAFQRLAMLRERGYADESIAVLRAGLFEQRLDDAAFEVFVAMRQGEPLGFVALQQVGQIGRLSDIYVDDSSRRQGVATALVSYACATARRWALRPVCVDVLAGAREETAEGGCPPGASDGGAMGLLQKAHFAFGGTINVFRRSEHAAGQGAWW